MTSSVFLTTDDIFRISVTYGSHRSSKRFLGFMNACFRGDSNLRLASPRIFENLAAIDTIAGNLTHKSYQKASISNHLNLLQVTGIQSSKAVFCHFG